MSIELLAILCGIVIFFGMGTIIAMRFRRRPTGALANAPSCGSCGYCVVGLEGAICPECGSDLRRVGIIDPSLASKRSNPFVSAVLFWLIACILVQINLPRIVLSRLPYVRRTEQSATITCRSSYLSIDVIAVASGRVTDWGLQPQTPATHLELTLQRAARVFPPMNVDLRTGAYAFTDAQGKDVARPSGFGAEALAEWFSECNVQLKDPRANDVNDMLSCINTLAAARGAGGFSQPVAVAAASPVLASPFFRIIRVEWWASISLFALWLIVTFAGLALIRWWFKRATSDHAANQADSSPAFP